MASKKRAQSRGKIGKGSRRRTTKKEKFIAKRNKRSKPDYSGLTGRDRGIATQYASSRGDKIKRLEQSVGSLDRRITKALEEGDTDQAKDLRSRQNKFVKNLSDQRMLQSGNFAKDSSGRAIKDSSGRPIGDTRGQEIRDFTTDIDFIDPTRRIMNKYPDQFAKMYPIQSGLEKGLKFLMKDFKRRDIPYSDKAMYEGEMRDQFGNIITGPGRRYPLEGSLPSVEGIEEQFFGRSKDPDYKQPYLSYPGYNEEVTISDLVDDKSVPFNQNLPFHTIRSQAGVNRGDLDVATDPRPYVDKAKDQVIDPSEAQALSDLIQQHIDPATGRYNEEYYRDTIEDDQSSMNINPLLQSGAFNLGEGIDVAELGLGVPEPLENIDPFSNLSLQDYINLGASDEQLQQLFAPKTIG